MSVYPRPTGYWHYDFVLGGKRYHGSTGVKSRRAAEEVERKRRVAAATGVLGDVAQMTLDSAAGRYWAEKGEGRGDAPDVERRIDVLLAIIGKKTKLADINQATVARAIEVRRGMPFKKGRDRTLDDGTVQRAKEYAPSDSTVNRDIIETLRPILKRAKTHWAAKGASHGLPEIDWRELRLSEPRGLSRIYSAPERQAWLDAAPDDVRLAVDMLLTYGLRLGELLFPLSALDLESIPATLTLQKGRKRDVILRLPLRSDHVRLLAARLSRARKAKVDTVWIHQKRDKVRALTYAQLEYRISKAADEAGIGGGRRIHGARHHAGSTILRKTSNLKAVQGLLGHASISSSQRYAHVQIEDLWAAIEDDIPRHSPDVVTDEARAAKAKRK